MNSNTVSISGDSAEAVAYALLQQYLAGEVKKREARGMPWHPTKEWLLGNYHEFLAVVKGETPAVRDEEPAKPPIRRSRVAG